MKFKGYADENNFLHDVEYEVTIYIAPNWNKEKICKFIKDNLPDINIVSIENKVVKLLWPLEAYSGEEEIVMAMYEMLKQGELGTYDYTRVN